MKNDAQIIILARTSSKRLPRKVFQEIEPGLSLLARCVMECKKTPWSVLISSDTQDALDHSLEAGADDTIIGQCHLDHSTSFEAVEYAIREKKIEAETIILAQVTNPFFVAQDIVKAYRISKEFGLSVFAARREDHIWWSWQESGPLFPTFQGVRSQDLPPVFLPCGAFFIALRAVLMGTKSFFKPQARPFEIANKNSVDIDTMDDLYLARYLWHRQQSRADHINSDLSVPILKAET